MFNTNGYLQTGNDEWTTPDYLYDQLNDEFHFNLDPCSTDENAKCEKHYTIAQDGLTQDWGGYTVFCNPPYSPKIQNQWVKKCYEESLKPNTIVVALLPVRTDTERFHKYILGKAEIRFIKGRIHFGNCANSAPFPNMICIWR